MWVNTAGASGTLPVPIRTKVSLPTDVLVFKWRRFVAPLGHKESWEAKCYPRAKVVHSAFVFFSFSF